MAPKGKYKITTEQRDRNIRIVLPDLVRLNYKLTKEVIYLKVKKLPVRWQMVDQTETYTGYRGQSEKSFWTGCLRTAQEDWHGNFNSCDFPIHVMDACSSKILSHQ